MATTFLPTLIDTLVTQADAALSVIVSDGFAVTDDPGDFLMIGVDDPDALTPANSADVTQEWGPFGGSPVGRDERGELTCAALSWNGDANMKAARDAVFATVAAVENLLRTNPTLGQSPTLLWTRFGSGMQLSQAQDEAGALALVVFRIAYQARI